MQFVTGKIDEQLFTLDARPNIVGEGGKQIRESLNAFSLPVAIIHASELLEQRTENNVRVYRYLLTDVGRSGVCEVRLTPDDKFTSIVVAEVR
jgi:hypothetical protein